MMLGYSISTLTHGVDLESVVLHLYQDMVIQLISVEVTFYSLEDGVIIVDKSISYIYVLLYDYVLLYVYDIWYMINRNNK